MAPWCVVGAGGSITGQLSAAGATLCAGRLWADCGTPLVPTGSHRSKVSARKVPFERIMSHLLSPFAVLPTCLAHIHLDARFGSLVNKESAPARQRPISSQRSR